MAMRSAKLTLLLAGGILAVSLPVPVPGLAADADTAAPMFAIATPDFVQMVTSANAFEIRSSELARDKARTPAIKEFAVAMIADHTKARNALTAALGDKAPAPDAPLAPRHAAMIALLEGADGAEFERLYVDMQVGAHFEAVSLFQTFAASGDDPAVVTFAKQTLPVLERHKTHILQIAAAP